MAKTIRMQKTSSPPPAKTRYRQFADSCRPIPFSASGTCLLALLCQENLHHLESFSKWFSVGSGILQRISVSVMIPLVCRDLHPRLEHISPSGEGRKISRLRGGRRRENRKHCAPSLAGLPSFRHLERQHA